MKSPNLAALLTALAVTLSLPAQTITTIAGGSATGPGDGGAATLAFLNKPYGLALTTKAAGSIPAGSLLIADELDNRIRVVTPNGIISTFAGAGPAGFLDGPAATAQFYVPSYVRPDANGNVYVSDLLNRRIRKIDASGNVTTIAGTGLIQDGPDNTAATASNFQYVGGIAIDSNGLIYIADAISNRIRRIDTGGTITTFAGNGTAGYSGDGGPATSSILNGPTALIYEPTRGDIYVADVQNARIRRINAAGVISTFMGCGTVTDAVNCPAITTVATGTTSNPTRTRLQNPQTVAVGPDGIYVLDYFPNNGFSVIYRVDLADGTATIVGGINGQGVDMVVVSQTQIYISEVSLTRTVQLITGAGPKTYAGGGLLDGSQATAVGIIGPPPAQVVPAGIRTDASGNVYFSDYGENVVRKIDASGRVSTVAGNGLFASNGENIPAVQASLAGPLGIDFDNQGNLYIAESAASRIRKVTPAGIISTYAGTGTRGFSGDGGPAKSATLSIPSAVAFDASTNSLYIADSGTIVGIVGNDRIRKVDASGNISTYAGTGYPNPFALPCGSLDCGDGGLATAAILSTPVDIVVDSSGNLYIGERYLQVNQSQAVYGLKIRKVDASTKKISTIAGNGNADLGGEGGGALQASLGFLAGMTIDKNSGNLFVSDDLNNRILRISSTVTRIAGTGSTTGGFSGESVPAAGALLNRPEGLTLDNNGALIFWDAGNNRIRKITGVGTQLPRTLVSISGNSQTALVSNSLPKTLTVQALDGTTPVAGLTVTFTVNPTGAATLSQTTVQTDASGMASTQVTVGATASNFTVTATSTGLATITFNETAQSALAGVAEGASFINNGSLAPGTIGSLFGNGLASTTDSASVTPLPTKLAIDTSLKVTFGTTTLTAPLFFVSPGQINFQLPFEVTGSLVNLVLSTGGVDSPAFPLGVTATAPGIFAKNSQGTGLGAVLHGISFLPVNASSPAKQGEVVSLFCAGLGLTTPVVASGVATPGDQLYNANATVTATIGGLPATVSFSGLASGFVGLYQVNVTVPTTVTVGQNVTVAISAGGNASNVVTIPVAAQ